MNVLQKKGVVPAAFVIVGAVLLVLVSLYVFKEVSGNDVDSLTPKKNGCDDVMGVRVSGTLNIGDGTWIGIDPEPKKIDVNEVRTYKLGIFDEDYTWEVCIVNSRTNNKKCDGGRDSLGGGDEVTKDFIIDFSIPDNNCDGIIDDFDTEIEATVEQDDEEVTITDKLVFRDGGWEQKD